MTKVISVFVFALAIAFVSGCSDDSTQERPATSSGGSAGKGGTSGSSSGGGSGGSVTDASPPDADAAEADCGAGGVDWGRAVVDSTNTRFPTPKALGGWEYSRALFLHGEFRVYQRTHDPKYLAYVKAWVDSQLDTSGKVSFAFDNLDGMLAGNLLLDLYVETKDPKYLVTAQTIRDGFDTYPRTSDGAFWHNVFLVGETWGDGVFMSMPFLARHGALVGNATAFDEATKQLLLYHEHLKHPSNGLHYHAWDEQGDASWTDTATHHSAEIWCRAVGWYSMATIEVLEVLPPTHPDRAQVVSVLQGLVAGIAAAQDPQTGRWFQVVDKQSDPANWLETSCSSMFTYVASRAVERGYVDAKYAAVADKGYQGVLQKISLGPDGLTNISDICVGTGVGDLAYYFARPRLTNDFHGLGAFLIMVEQLAPNCPAK